MARKSGHRFVQSAASAGGSQLIALGVPTLIVSLLVAPPALVSFVVVALGIVLVYLELSSVRAADVQNPRPVGTVLLFLVSTVVAAIRSATPGVSWMVVGFVVSSVLAYTLITRHPDLVAERIYCTAFTVASASVSALILGAYIHALAIRNPDSPTVLQDTMAVVTNSSIVVPNDVTVLSILGAFQLPFILGDAHRGTSRILSVIVLLAAVASVVVLRSRTGAIALGTVVLVFAWYRQRKSLVTAILGVTAAFAIVDRIVGGHLLAKVLSGAVEDRLALWRIAWQMFANAPIFGHGGQAFWTSQIDSRALELSLGNVVPWAHNLYLETLAEQGLIGGVALLGLLGRGLWIGARAMRSSEYANDLTLAAFAAIAAFSVVSLIELTFLHRWVSVTMLTLLAVIEVSSTRKRST